MLQSVFSKKKQEMAHSFKKNLNIVLRTIKQANQKEILFTVFLTASSTTVHLRLSFLCEIQGIITVTICLFLTCTECTVHTVQ